MNHGGCSSDLELPEPSGQLYLEQPATVPQQGQGYCHSVIFGWRGTTDRPLDSFAAGPLWGEGTVAKPLNKIAARTREQQWLFLDGGVGWIARTYGQHGGRSTG